MSAPATQLVVGLIGEICAGKSTAAAAFKQRGAQIYDADALVHELYQRADVKEELRAAFGAGIFGPDGQLDRKKLGAIVFNDPAQLQRLTQQIVFPRTGRLLSDAIAAFRRSPDPVLIVDAPTLLEAGHEGCCDRIVFLGAPRQRRLEWARARGWDETEMNRREARMLPVEHKRQRASAVLENSGSRDDLARQVDELWDRWLT